MLTYAQKVIILKFKALLKFNEGVYSFPPTHTPRLKFVLDELAIFFSMKLATVKSRAKDMVLLTVCYFKAS